MGDKAAAEYEIRKRTDAAIPNISAGKPKGKGPQPVDNKVRTPSRG
ncbi:unnamed protein product [Mycolicibacterium canariasense]|uniref:Uncharacterized protein n=1 Tax=Mycolicibacterium canariasense TaxID=228230 RepID=A0A100WCS4_MYCCR|nr:hypothetical protein [Mycolicibacterium canariasense]MCV7212796.1 hypothetical protein [Mycolicibacterium canariasense]GAS95641.1 unnamed protein product [Mycolicibacterium canariasense]